ncbi:GGDEF domain-containing protein [Pelagibacterium lacus]|nr:sensor domain-containing diguanylate cyclase [Pelagibacterium lacus]
MIVDTFTDEEGRLAALHRHGLPGAAGDAGLARMVQILATALGVPMAALSMLDRTQQVFLATRGLEGVPVGHADSLAAQLLAGPGPLAIADCTGDPRLATRAMVAGAAGIRAWLAVPLVTPDGYVLGAIEAFDTAPRAFGDGDMAIAADLAQLAMTHLAARLPESFDGLTGALTRRRFQAEVEREYDRARRYDRPAALVFLDLDGFRELNRSIGLQTADQILKAIANRSMETLRASDSFGRIGGEEFGLLLPETLAYEASQCAERLREDIARLRFRSPDGVLSVTASFGIAPLNAQIKSAVDWFARADIALYGSKQAGRNCVSFAAPGDDPEAPGRSGEGLPRPDRMH